ncbi:MAG TPA: LamG domain-containing protein [Candidatus Omnitrophota bacterium]|nr:LamG domain-containing protein [Candidatus Omnitrophota bacterium]
MTVLIIIILVPIIVFGTTFFITSSITRYDAQTRSMKALYLAESGIHKAIFNIKSTGTPLPVTNWDANNQIVVTVVAQCSNIYQLKSIGTSVASGNSISRTVFAQYDHSATKITLYLEGEGTGIPPPVCCDQIWWPFSEGAGFTTGTAPYVGTLTPSNATGPAWVAGRIGTALRFNQGATHNYVTVPDANGLDLTTSGSIMAWIYITAQVNNNAGIVHKGNLSNSNDEAYGLVINRTGANRRIRILLRDAGGVERSVTENTNLALNTWYHVAGTWGATGMRLYLNGNPVNFDATVRVARATAGNLQIGTRATNSATTRFIGTIDEAYIYACQKTAQEILDYYNATKP